jgi:hypothetical protein
MPHWTLVYSARHPHDAELVRGLLESHGIRAVVLDQGSSPYPPIAEVGVYVDRDDVVRALYIVRQHAPS